MELIDRIKTAVKVLVAGNLDTEDIALLEELTALDEIPEEYACAVLLVDLSLIDQQFDTREYEFIHSFLERRFGLNGDMINNLIKGASQSIGNLRGSYTYASHLRKRLSAELRQQLVVTLSKLVVADEKTDGFEQHLLKKLEDLLTAESQ